MQGWQQTRWILWGGLVVAGMFVGWQGARGVADDKPAQAPPPKGSDAGQGEAKPPVAPRLSRDTELRTFMRKKLAASNKILEGLATDDFELVKAGARQLNEMSSAERWFVSADPVYRQFSGEFREITAQVLKAAEDGNADRVAMKWMDATISCLDCHRFVRGMHVAQE